MARLVRREVEERGYASVIYARQVVEEGTVEKVLTHPNFPTRWALSNAFPDLLGSMDELIPIDGNPPDLRRPPDRCRFRPRCPFSIAGRGAPVALQRLDGGRSIACIRSHEAAVIREEAKRTSTWRP